MTPKNEKSQWKMENNTGTWKMTLENTKNTMENETNDIGKIRLD